MATPVSNLCKTTASNLHIILFKKDPRLNFKSISYSAKFWRGEILAVSPATAKILPSKCIFKIHPHNPSKVVRYTVLKISHTHTVTLAVNDIVLFLL